ncbi:MAG TPA: SRPBCC family protein [Dehalococcoidia bacterium]|jgi:uncharacterized protein YndB with AHSA1/START domain|nr:SRPBCC family protein [Dehalococcoidia bacterium]
MNDGTIEQTGERVVFHYERRLPHPVEVVWKAITDPERMAGWLGHRPEIDLRVGGQYVSYHGTGDRVVDRILRLEPPRLFEHTFWEQVNPTAVVTWKLEPTADGCLLTLTHALGLSDIRTASTTVARGDGFLLIVSRNAAGWHRLLDKLAAALDGRSDAWSPEQQEALRERYAAQLA